MNSGIISSRYATALLKRVTETGRGQQVCDQVEQLLENPEVLIQSLEPDLKSFVEVIAKNGRQEYLKLALNTFVRKYYESAGIKMALLTTAAPAPGLEEKLSALIHEKMGCSVKMKTKVDPNLIGGFTFVVDDLLLDASVSRQIDLIRRELIEKTNRIV